MRGVSFLEGYTLSSPRHEAYTSYFVFGSICKAGCYRFKPSQTRPTPLFLANLSLKSPLAGFSRSFKIPKGDVIKQKHYRGGRCHVPTNCGIWFHLIDLDIMLHLQTHDVHLACWFFIVFVKSSLLLHVLLHFFDVMFFWFLLSTLNLITTAAHPSHGKNRTFQEAFCWEGPNNDLEINTRTMLDMQINRLAICDVTKMTSLWSQSFNHREKNMTCYTCVHCNSVICHAKRCLLVSVGLGHGLTFRNSFKQEGL